MSDLEGEWGQTRIGHQAGGVAARPVVGVFLRLVENGLDSRVVAQIVFFAFLIFLSR